VSPIFGLAQQRFRDRNEPKRGGFHDVSLTYILRPGGIGGRELREEGSGGGIDSEGLERWTVLGSLKLYQGMNPPRGQKMYRARHARAYGNP